MKPNENQSAQPGVLAAATKCLLRRLSNSRAAAVFARVALTCALVVFCISTSPTHAEERTYTNGDMQIRCSGDAPAVRGGRVVDGIRIKEKALESGGVEVTAVDRENCYLVFKASQFSAIPQRAVKQWISYLERENGEIIERGTPIGVIGDEILARAYRKCDQKLNKGEPAPPSSERSSCRSIEVRRLNLKTVDLNFVLAPLSNGCEPGYFVMAFEGRFRQVNYVCAKYEIGSLELSYEDQKSVAVDWPND